MLTLPESLTPARISSSSDMTFSTVIHTQNFNGSLSISIEGINTTSITMSNHTANVGLFIGVEVFSTVTTVIEENHTQNFNGSLSISIEGINTTSTTMSNHTANIGLFIGVGVFLIIAGLLITCSATCIGCAVRHRRKKMKK